MFLSEYSGKIIFVNEVVILYLLLTEQLWSGGGLLLTDIMQSAQIIRLIIRIYRHKCVLLVLLFDSGPKTRIQI